MPRIGWLGQGTFRRALVDKLARAEGERTIRGSRSVRTSDIVQKETRSNCSTQLSFPDVPCLRAM